MSAKDRSPGKRRPGSDVTSHGVERVMVDRPPGRDSGIKVALNRNGGGATRHGVANRHSVEESLTPSDDDLVVEPQRPMRRAESRQAGAGHPHLRLALLAVVIIAAGAGAGLIGALVLPKEYAARAELKYSLSEAMPNELLREDRRLTTSLVMFQSRTILGPVAAKNAMAPEDLGEKVSAKVVDGSEFIEVQVRDRSRERALMLLTEIVERYVSVANSNWQDPVIAYVNNDLSEVRAYLEAELNEVQNRLNGNDLAAPEATQLAYREVTLRRLLGPIESPSRPPSATGPPAEVLTQPYLMAKPAFPKPLFATAAGGALGIVIAAVVVLVAARRRNLP